MGGRFLKGLAYLALFAVIALTSCQASFAAGATGRPALAAVAP
jgi:hypothetical protein